MAEQQVRKSGLLRRIVRWTLGIVIVLLLLGGVASGFAFRDALQRRFSEFPKTQAAWEKLRTQRAEVALDDGWSEFRGICHSHSELSHDCEVTFPQILEAAKKADIRFIFMSDHCDGNNADYSKGWKGNHDGVLFVRGYEMAEGFMPWGLPDETILKKDEDPKVLSAQIEQAGGLLFFAHTEEPRQWDLPELDGMEIYNIHTDVKDESYGDLLPDAILSGGKYGDHVLRRVFDRQTAILENWDKLNLDRNITGIAANDCHQNNGLRGFYTDRDTLLLCTTAKDDVVKEINLNFLTRTLLRLLPGPFETGRELFRVELDPYERQMRFVNTHLLANVATEEALLEALKLGRAFIAFDMIADARGFVFLAEDASGKKGVMGDTVQLGSGVKLRAESPLPVRFTLMCDGVQVDQQTGRTYERDVQQAGKYRLEAELDVDGTWTPWIYTNPIRVARVVETAAPAGV